MKKIILAAILILSGFISTYSQDHPEKKIAILPFYSNGLDEVSIQTAESILRLEISKISPMDIVSARRTNEVLNDNECSEVDCALDIAKHSGRKKVTQTDMKIAIGLI